MEWLDRGVVALNNGSGMFISWRLLASEYGSNIAFNVYRNDVKINAQPITNVTNYTGRRRQAGRRLCDRIHPEREILHVRALYRSGT